jgi:hypothetical protein
MLENILNNQTSSFEKTKLCYNPNNTLQKIKEETKSYATTLNNTIEHGENTNKPNYDQHEHVVFKRNN